MDFKCRRTNNICFFSSGWRVLPVLSLLATVLLFLVICTVLYPITHLGQKKYAIQPVNFKVHSSHDNIRQARILCLILTTTSGKNKMAAIRDTWARRCDKYLFIYGKSNLSQTEDSLYVPVPEGRGHLTAKVRHALQYAYRTFNDSFDWILKCDDDTYVIVENLRFLLSDADPKKPGYLGFHMKTQVTKRYGYMSGGAGYVVSSSALHQLIERGFQNGSCRQDGGSEDEEIGLCLAKLGVPVLRSLDTFGRESFHPEPLQKLLYPPHPKWLHEYTWNQLPKFGEECCSKFSISFHRVSPEHLLVYDHLLYKTEVHGRKGDHQDTLPVFSPRTEKPAF